MAATTTELGKTDVANSVGVALGSLAAVAVAGLFAAAVGLPDAAVGTLTSLAAGVVPAGVLARQQLRRSRETRLRELTVSSDVTNINPVYVALLLASGVLLLDSVIGGLLGAIVGATLNIAGVQDSQVFGTA